MSTTPEITGTLRVAWDDDENLRFVIFFVDYAIEPYEPADHFTLTPPCGGAVEITSIRIISCVVHDSGSPARPWLAIGLGTNHVVTADVAAHLVACYERSKAYESLKDACRAHAESEA